jgi:hypothetical protein
MLTTAPTASVRSRRLLRVRDCATYRSEKISEGVRFRLISHSDQHIDQ